MQLDEQQRIAVESTAKNTIVAAGAGSGKTRVLVERVRWLIEHGVRPNSIVAITFTNMAAQEMQERLSDIPRSGDMFIGTIHSFANRIFRNSGAAYEILNEAIQEKYMRHLCRKYARFLTIDRYLEYMDFRKMCDLGKADEGDVKELFSAGERNELRIFLSHQEPDSETARDYPTNVGIICSRNHVITFDELLRMAGEYFKTLGSGNIDHLLVDEFQDIGHLEYRFLKDLQANNRFYVGDDWQAIYSFKGGNSQIFKSLITSLNWTRVDLVNNYRNSPIIVHNALSVINQDPDRLAKEVVCIQEELGSVEESSKFFLEKYLEEEVAPSADLRKWFVLVRSNRDLLECKERMEAMGIPVTTFRKSDISWSELQDVMAENTVKLLTVHMAKGLEADNVLMWGPFQLNPPSYLSKPEERRVLYVGMTRARKRCIILR